MLGPAPSLDLVYHEMSTVLGVGRVEGWIQAYRWPSFTALAEVLESAAVSGGFPEPGPELSGEKHTLGRWEGIALRQ